jgi:hypothetical protein
MTGCFVHDHTEKLAARQSATLKAALAINAATFLVMVAAALYANSSALLSESLDNLGDALTYGISLYAVLRSMRYSTALQGYVRYLMEQIERRAPSTTLAPCAERRRAVATPSPLLAPVITTTFPSMFLLMIVNPCVS